MGLAQCPADVSGSVDKTAASDRSATAMTHIHCSATLPIITGSIARSANLPVFSLLRGRF